MHHAIRCPTRQHFNHHATDQRQRSHHPHFEEIHAFIFHQIGRQPGNKEIGGVVDGEKANAHCPDIAVAQQLVPLHRPHAFVAVLLRLAITDEAHFLLAYRLMIFRIFSVDKVPGNHPEQAQRTYCEEGQTPVEQGDHKDDQRHGHRTTKFGGTVEQARNRGAFAIREPARGNARVAGIGGGFTDAER